MGPSITPIGRTAQNLWSMARKWYLLKKNSTQSLYPQEESYACKLDHGEFSVKACLGAKAENERKASKQKQQKRLAL